VIAKIANYWIILLD